jgi:hypothetical protein
MVCWRIALMFVEGYGQNATMVKTRPLTPTLHRYPFLMVVFDSGRSQ